MTPPIRGLLLSKARTAICVTHSLPALALVHLCPLAWPCTVFHPPHSVFPGHSSVIRCFLCLSALPSHPPRGKIFSPHLQQHFPSLPGQGKCTLSKVPQNLVHASVTGCITVLLSDLDIYTLWFRYVTLWFILDIIKASNNAQPIRLK